MEGFFSIAVLGGSGRGRAVWAAWWSMCPRPGEVPTPDANGEAVDVHAAKQAVFAAFARARGVTTFCEVDGRFAREDFQARQGKKKAKRGPRSDLPLPALRLLGLVPPVTLREARDAYRRRALAIHPDRGGSHDAMLELNRAWEQLRRAFDDG